MSKLILMAPMQIKTNLSVGNVYDLLLCDFYSKLLSLSGDKGFFPLLLNVNGSPIEGIASSLQRNDYRSLATDCIGTILEESASYGIRFDAVLRDDDEEDVIKGLLPSKAFFDVNCCPKCNSMYGTDFSIKRCRRCGETLKRATRESLGIKVVHQEMHQKIEKILFMQESAKLRLDDFVTTLPDEYNLVLEKNRKYTTSIDGIQIDPRYTAISLLVAARKKFPGCSTSIHIHGDVVKKFTYYVLAYLPDDFTPDVDFMHGNVVDSRANKVRNPLVGKNSIADSLKVNQRELRAYLLSCSARRNVILESNIVHSKVRRLAKTFVLCERVLDGRNYILGTKGIRAQIEGMLNDYCRLAESWNLSAAYEVADQIIHVCWKIVKDSKLTEEEVVVIRTLKSLYFGD